MLDVGIIVLQDRVDLAGVLKDPQDGGTVRLPWDEQADRVGSREEGAAVGCVAAHVISYKDRRRNGDALR